MNRLLPELDRLYGLDMNALDGPAAGAADAGLEHGIRAMVLEVTLPAGWDQLSSVWTGVQSDLGLPAPAIAVSGVDGLQLWFSLASPTSSSAGARFLRGLRAQYLPNLASTHVRVFADAARFPAAPPVETSSQHWSAFVTSELASVFAETPWLDIPPSDEGQATILRALESTRQSAFEAALNKLAAVEDDADREPNAAKRSASGAAEKSGTADVDPARFLMGVLNDESAPLALRIKAAGILLPYAKGS